MFMMPPFSFIKKSVSFTTGTDGGLVIISGQTVDIAEGSVKQYSSINIATGGTLRITGNTGAWTEIGCSGSCVINGAIIARAGYDGQTTHNGGTFTKTSSFGLGLLSYTIAQSLGGSGGNGSNFGANYGRGGAGTSGIGGGGGGASSLDIGGNGGSGGSAGVVAVGFGGAGGGLGNGSTNSTSGGGSNVSGGGAGASGGGGGGSNSFSSPIYNPGGAGGGYKGHHGKGLVLYIEGALSGTGAISLSGRSGFIGASSSFNAAVHTPSTSGGSGGGGAGGSGGKLIVKYASIGTSPVVNVAGGTGGAGGSGASSGLAGSAGSSLVQSI